MVGEHEGADAEVGGGPFFPAVEVFDAFEGAATSGGADHVTVEAIEVALEEDRGVALVAEGLVFPDELGLVGLVGVELIEGGAGIVAGGDEEVVFGEDGFGAADVEAGFPGESEKFISGEVVDEDEVFLGEEGGAI